ncbi:efflux RND transporter permease subunit [Bacteroidaceae bacterium HV4-6-C5C]|nr:efflux RND transporter permease subunit [Bacteroidaceae bacterium HV4-6-C5C]
MKFFTNYKSPLSVLIVLIILGGMFAYSRMQTALFPEITFPKIKVIADAGEQPVDKMMVTVTKPIENAIKRVQDLQTVRSTTSRGSCEISAFMDWNCDIDLSKQRIESEISRIRGELPPDVQITVEKMNPSILQVMGYSLEGKGYSPIEMKMLALYTIKPFLSQVEGVSEVRVLGGKTKEYWVILDQQKMSSLGITPEMVNTALSQSNFIQSNGYLADYRMLYLSVTDAQIYNLDALKKIVVFNDGKRIIRLDDIAGSSIQEAKEYIKINANGKEGVQIAIFKQPNANLLAVSNAMKMKIEELKKVLPSNVHIRPFYVQAEFVQDAIKSVGDSLWIGLALAILVAILFLRSLKASLTVLITIPVTLCLTLLVLYATNGTLNIMTLGAIAAAIGLIIDDAIVVVEQIHRTHEENPDEKSTVLVGKAIKYLLPAMVGSSISTIVIFIPFILMSGVAGAYFKVMTDTMVITLICSFFVTWILLPIIYLLLSGKSEISAHHAVHKVKKQVWVQFFIKRPWISFVIVAGLLSVIIFVVPLLETGFLPEMDEGSIVLDYVSPPGTSLEETDRMLNEVEKLIIATPEVQAYSRRTGTQMGFFITEPNTGDYLIQLKKDRKKTTEEVIDDIRRKIESTQPALRVDFGQVVGDMLGDLMASVQPVEIKIFGNDQKQLQKLSGEVSALVGKVDGTADIFNGIVIAGPSVNVKPNYNTLAQYGITPMDFQYQLQTSQEGNIVGNVLEKEQNTPIRMLYPHSREISLADMGRLQLFTSNGKLIPITSLAHISASVGEAEIERENLQMIGVVTARLDNRDLGSVMSDIRRQISSTVHLPQGYHIEYCGAYKEQQQSFGELQIVLIASCLLVFVVMLFLFRDLWISSIILFIAILGVGGSFLLLYLTNTPLNVGSYTGLIMIVGIIGENAVFTIQQFRTTLQVTGDPEQSVIYAISTRLRPKLMTALGAIIALMPLALAIGTGAQMHQPLAIAVIGGFLAALPLLLIVLPSLLLLASRKRDVGS